MNILLLGVMAVAAIVGFAFVPALVLFGYNFVLYGAVPDSLREVTARITFTLGQFAADGSALRVSGNAFEIERMETNDDGEYVVDGEVIDPKRIYYFGLNDFAVISDGEPPDPQYLLPPDAPLDRRQGIREFRPWDDDATLVNLSTVVERLRGATGVGMIEDGMEKALKESGSLGKVGPIAMMAITGGLIIAGFLLVHMVL